MKRPVPILAALCCIMVLGLLLRGSGTQTEEQVLTLESIESEFKSGDWKAIQRDVRGMISARYAGDYDLYLNHSYAEPILTMSPEEARLKRPLAESAFRTYASIGLKLDSITFLGPPRFLKSERRELVIVSTRVISSMQDHRMEEVDFHIGVRDIGATRWRFIRGSKRMDAIQQLLPEFSEDFEFPKCHALPQS